MSQSAQRRYHRVAPLLAGEGRAEGGGGVCLVRVRRRSPFFTHPGLDRPRQETDHRGGWDAPRLRLAGSRSRAAANPREVRRR